MDDPGMFRVSRESTDTLTGGGGKKARRPWIIQGCSECPGKVYAQIYG